MVLAGVRPTAWLSGVWFGILAALVVGCATPPGPIFEGHRPVLEWPPPPDQPRIRYVGQLASSADLKPARGPFQALGDLLVGAREPRQLYGPRSALSISDAGRVWVADPGGRCLHLFDLNQRTYRRVHHLGEAPLLCPVDICAGPGNTFYVCDSEAAAIHRLSAADGVWIESLRVPEELVRPAALAYDAALGELFVVDAGAHNIKVLGPDGSLRRILGQRGAAAGEFNFPCDVAIGEELVWVADAGNQRVQGLTPYGEPVAMFGQAGDAVGDLALPKGVALDSEGHVYVVDARFENIQVFDQSGRLLLVFGEEGTGPGEFWLPAGIFIDGNNRLWICDTYNGRVQVFDYLPDAPAADSDAGARATDRAVAPEIPRLSDPAGPPSAGEQE